MLGTAYKGTVDWLIIESPSMPNVTIHAHATFLMSSWECQFGKCPGIIGPDDETFAGDAGCCTTGFYVSDADDLNHIERMIGQLTDEDWDTESRKYVERKGWQHWKTKPQGDPHDPANDDTGWVLKSRVRNGACVFANRTDGSVGSTGKIGCAFLHLGQRLQREQINKAARDPHAKMPKRDDIVQLDDDGVHDARHDIYMPMVCHQLPLRFVYDHDDEGEIVSIAIQPWDADEWPGDDSEYFGNWWCVAEGTPVTTERGPVPIEHVSEGERVLTRAGFRQVTSRWDNGERPVIKVVHEGGTLTVTEDHELLTNLGWLTGRQVRTLTADTVPAPRSDPGVLGRVPVTAGAGVAPSGAERFAASHVLGTGHAIEVPDVATDATAAQVVKLVALGDRPVHCGPDVDGQVAGDAVELRHAIAAANPLAPEVDAVVGVEQVGVDESIGVDGGHFYSVHQVIDAGTARVYDLSVEGQHEYVAGGVVVHNCVDDPAAYTAETALYTRMRGTIEGVIGVEAYEVLAKELDRRAQTVSAMPVLGKGIAEGRPLIPLAVAGKKLAKPAPTFMDRWQNDLKLDSDGTVVLK